MASVALLRISISGSILKPIIRLAILGLGFPDQKELLDFINGESIMLRLSDDSFRVDLLKKLNIKKNFSEAYPSCEVVSVPYGNVYFISYDDLIDEKIRAKRPKDIVDVQELRKIKGDVG